MQRNLSSPQSKSVPTNWRKCIEWQTTYTQIDEGKWFELDKNKNKKTSLYFQEKVCTRKKNCGERWLCEESNKDPTENNLLFELEKHG